MKWKISYLQARLYLIAVIISVVGSSGSMAIYLTAQAISEDGLVYQFEHSKRYRHDLEVIGGKANVLADDFYRWFASFWHGKALAFTLACITAIFSFAFVLVAYNLPPESKPDDHSENG